jgi:hypothetical protein
MIGDVIIKSHQQERSRVTAVEFIRRLVQHILPKEFQRVRYYGLHAGSAREKVVEAVRRAIGAVIQMAFYYAEAIMIKLVWRAKIKREFGRPDEMPEVWRRYGAVEGMDADTWRCVFAGRCPGVG